MPRRPSSDISRSTSSGEGIRPQPGTSHAPHEIGAPASRSAIGTAALRARACVACILGSVLSSGP